MNGDACWIAWRADLFPGARKNLRGLLRKGVCGRIEHMPYAVEFPASELRDVTLDDTHARLRLSAAAARDDAGERGWLTGVTLAIGAATLQGDTAHAFGKIVEATLRQGDDHLRRFDIPATLGGQIELALRLANGAHIVIRGDALEASLGDDARFREDFSC